VTILKIGLLGGTFDPVHFGHLQLAEVALRECELDKVFFVPAASPPHKDELTVTSFAHRVAMLEIASAHSTRFACSSIEGRLPAPSYTIDTLRALGDAFLEKSDLFFIIGVDAFLDLKTWKSYHEILRLVNIVVAQRKGYRKNQLIDFLELIGYTRQSNCWHGDDGRKKVFLLDARPGNFSSTLIRKKIAGGILPTGDIPEGVIDYIIKHQLYQSKLKRAQHLAGHIR
jgi:nicotinate-nucleotide adenylyltransferase